MAASPGDRDAPDVRADTNGMFDHDHLDNGPHAMNPTAIGGGGGADDDAFGGLYREKPRPRRARLRSGAPLMRRRDGARRADGLSSPRQETTMTTEETRTINDKLDAILARVGGLESRMNGIENEFAGIRNEFATLKGELRASIWQTSFQIIAVYAGAIGITFALVRLYAA